MNIVVTRSFPVTVEVDGVTRKLRTTARTREALRRDLGVGRGLIPDGPSSLAPGAKVAFRTPHAVTIGIDGKTIDVPRSGALDVAELLREQGIAVGPRDEVTPAADTRLANGLRVHVYRLADGQVAERVPIPFPTETREDPNLRAGQTRVIRAGVPGQQRDVYKVRTRDDGTVVQRVKVGSELISAPVGQILAKGTQPAPAAAAGSATWYGTGPGPGTCAHLHLPFGTVVTITNRDTGASAQCRVQDRGPETWTGHIIDLAPDVFRRLAPLSQGVLPNVSLSYSR
jgi:resuscitation-promoting factor RpfB